MLDIIPNGPQKKGDELPIIPADQVQMRHLSAAHLFHAPGLSATYPSCCASSDD